MSDEAVQIWIRNDKGKVYGPLTPVSAELLVDNGIVAGKIQVSMDGNQYVYPGRMPGIRMVFPKDLWGDTVVPDDGNDEKFAKALPPPPLPGAESEAGAVAAGLPPPSASGPGGPPGPPVRGPAVVAGPAVRNAAVRPPTMSRPAVGKPQGAVNMRVGVAFQSGPAPSAPSGMRPAPSAPPAGPGAAPAPSAPSAPPPAASSPSGMRRSPSFSTTGLNATSIPPLGNLASISPLRLYFLAACQDLTGLLIVKLNDRELHIHFRKGNPEYVDSTHKEDSLPTFLLSSKLATADILAKAEAEKERFGGELVPALFGLGLINPSTAFVQLAERAAALLGRALQAELGTFSWENKELPPTKAMPLGHKWSVFMDQLRKQPGPEARRRLADSFDLPIMKSGGAVKVEDMKLKPQETRAYGWFDGVASVHQLAAQHPQEADVIIRLAWILKDCDLVSFATGALPPPANSPYLAGAGAAAKPAPAPAPAPAAPPPAAAPPPPAVAPPKVAPPTVAPAPSAPQAGAAKPASPAFPGGPPKVGPPTVAPAVAAARPPPVMQPAAAAPAAAAPVAAAPPAAPMNFDAETKKLAALWEAMKKQTHFEVLGLPKEADAGAAKAAYLKAARLYHPDTVPAGAPEAYAKARADVFARVVEANRVLSDSKAKADYLAELAAGGTGEKVDISAIFAAEEHFTKGQIMVKARKFPEAVAMLEDAIKGNPDEPEYYAWRGYARFFVASDKKAGMGEAMRDINACLKKNPKCANAYFFIGMMSKLTGDLKTAKTNFQKCAELDPKNIDCARELRTMK